MNSTTKGPEAPMVAEESGGDQGRIDLRVNVGCVDHVKIEKLCRLLGDGAFRWLVRLWTFAAENRPSGRLSDVDVEDIWIVSGCKDVTPEKWIDALLKFRLLDKDPDGVYCVHDWAEHQAWIVQAPERRKIAQLAASVRWERERQRALAASMPPAFGEDTGVVPPTPLPPPPSPVPTSYPDPRPSPVPKPSLRPPAGLPPHPALERKPGGLPPPMIPRLPPGTRDERDGDEEERGRSD